MTNKHYSTPHGLYLKGLGKKVKDLTTEEKRKYQNLAFDVRERVKEPKVCCFCNKHFNIREARRKKYCTKECAIQARESKVKKYFEENKEVLREQQHKYIKRNKAKILEYGKKWVRNNKEHNKQYAKEYRERNKEKIKILFKEYYEDKKDVISEKIKVYRSNLPEYKKQKIRDRARKKYYSDPRQKIRRVVSNLFCRIAKGKPSRTEEILGCTLNEAKNYIESLFEEGMSWENHGEWHVDHIRPVASIDPDNEEDIKQVSSIFNLRPMWAIDNILKGAKYKGVDYRSTPLYKPNY